jgi:hypothetical protein
MRVIDLEFAPDFQYKRFPRPKRLNNSIQLRYICTAGYEDNLKLKLQKVAATNKKPRVYSI